MKLNSPRCIAFIFARGGSKGVPGKNIKELAGKPLIAYSIEIAKDCPYLETVIVSTDDPAIAEIARSFGAEVPFLRPAELALDTTPEWKAWQHAIDWVECNRGKFDIFLSLPPTSPFRSVIDIEACLDTLYQNLDTDIVITVRESERSPYFNMIQHDQDGYARLVIQPEQEVIRRQDAPIVYDITTVVYAARPTFIKSGTRIFDGRVRTVLIPPERSLDIDTPFDFRIAECLAHASIRETK